MQPSTLQDAINIVQKAAVKADQNNDQRFFEKGLIWGVERCTGELFFATSQTIADCAWFKVQKENGAISVSPLPEEDKKFPTLN